MRRRSSRYLTIAIAIVGVSVGASGRPFAAPALGSQFVRQVVEFTRVGPPTSQLAVNFSNGTDGSISAALAFWMQNRHAAITGWGLLVTPGGYQTPETNATGSKLGCVTLPAQPALVCQSRVGGGIHGEITIDPQRTNTTAVVMAFVGDRRLLQVQLAPGSSGWVMHPLNRTVRILRTQDLHDTYLISASESIEHFQNASLPGGSHGSLVAVGVPCRGLAEAPIATGYGNATLSGGGQAQQLNCPSGPIFAFAAAHKATTWQLTGDIWGSTNSAIQLTGKLQANSVSSEDVRMLEVDGPF